MGGQPLIRTLRKNFSVCAIGPIRLLVLASYRSLTNQILIFAILDLNFQSEFQQYAGSSLASSVLLCGHNSLLCIRVGAKQRRRALT